MSERAGSEGRGRELTAEEKNQLICSTKRSKVTEEDSQSDTVVKESCMVVLVEENNSKNSETQESYLEVPMQEDNAKNQEEGSKKELFPTSTRESLKWKLVSYKDVCMGVNGQKYDHLSDDDLVYVDKSDSNSEEVPGKQDKEGREVLCPVVKITREERKLACEPWKKAIIVKLLGRKIGLRYLKTGLQKNVAA